MSKALDLEDRLEHALAPKRKRRSTELCPNHLSRRCGCAEHYEKLGELIEKHPIPSIKTKG